MSVLQDSGSGKKPYNGFVIGQCRFSAKRVHFTTNWISCRDSTYLCSYIPGHAYFPTPTLHVLGAGSCSDYRVWGATCIVYYSYSYLTFLFVNVRINMDSGRSGEALEDGRAIGDVEHVLQETRNSCIC